MALNASGLALSSVATPAAARNISMPSASISPATEAKPPRTPLRAVQVSTQKVPGPGSIRNTMAATTSCQTSVIPMKGKGENMAALLPCPGDDDKVPLGVEARHCQRRLAHKPPRWRQAVGLFTGGDALHCDELAAGCQQVAG